MLQSDSVETLAWSSAALVAMIVGLPLLFIGLGKTVIPYARGFEFSLLMMLDIVSASLNYQLGFTTWWARSWSASLPDC